MLLYVMLWTDMLLLGRLGSAAEVAIYRVAQNLLSPAQTISTSTGPDVRAAHRRRGRARRPRDARDDAEARHVLEHRALAARVPRAPAAPAGRCSGSSATATRTGAAALAILAAGQLFNAATGPLGQVINMSGRPYITMTNNAAVAR